MGSRKCLKRGLVYSSLLLGQGSSKAWRERSPAFLLTRMLVSSIVGQTKTFIFENFLALHAMKICIYHWKGCYCHKACCCREDSYCQRSSIIICPCFCCASLSMVVLLLLVLRPKFAITLTTLANPPQQVESRIRLRASKEPSASGGFIYVETEGRCLPELCWECTFCYMWTARIGRS